MRAKGCHVGDTLASVKTVIFGYAPERRCWP